MCAQSHVARVILLITLTTLGVFTTVVQPFSIQEISDRQYEITMDMMTYFMEEIDDRTSRFQEKLLDLEIKVADIEDKLNGVTPCCTLPEVTAAADKEYAPSSEDSEGNTQITESQLAAETQQQSSEVVPDDGPTYAPTCARIYESGYTYSGDYTIDPDGRGKKPPFTVYCDMDSGDGVTVVGHDKEEPNILVNGFENPGSFVFRPIYQHSATIQQLGALADASQDCRQFVRYACRGASLMGVHKPSRRTYAWWVDRYGQRRVNWGGAETDSGMCACGVSSSCFEVMPTCNCDSPNAKNQKDEGFFDDKDLLPIMSINLGDTGGKKERGAITLGKFICRG